MTLKCGILRVLHFRSSQPIVLRENLDAKNQSRMGEWGTPAQRWHGRGVGSRLEGRGGQHVASGIGRAMRQAGSRKKKSVRTIPTRMW